jgi:threonylcarbamoyladenosine tRNA methylthiotransferase MtaB
MTNKRVAFCTLGCKVNQYETNAMMQEFMKHEWEIVDFEEVANAYIINTCTVTNMADRKSRQMIRRVKEINPEAILVAVGCYAQVAKEELEKIPEIDLILGTNEKKNIYNLVNELVQDRNLIGKEEKNQKIDITDVLHCEEYAEFGEVTFTEKTRAVIKVQDGCDRFCSYCIIPFARGHIRSRKPENVISEITKIAKIGIKEVVITGIHLASYGRDFKEKNIKYGLIDLLEEINKIEGIQRIRLRFTRANINNKRICSKIIKIRKSMPSFSFIATKWL